jgi:hypothetical protein
MFLKPSGHIILPLTPGTRKLISPVQLDGVVLVLAQKILALLDWAKTVKISTQIFGSMTLDLINGNTYMIFLEQEKYIHFVSKLET